MAVNSVKNPTGDLEKIFPRAALVSGAAMQKCFVIEMHRVLKYLIIRGMCCFRRLPLPAAERPVPQRRPVRVRRLLLLPQRRRQPDPLRRGPPLLGGDRHLRLAAGVRPDRLQQRLGEEEEGQEATAGTEAVRTDDRGAEGVAERVQVSRRQAGRPPGPAAPHLLPALLRLPQRSDAQRGRLHLGEGVQPGHVILRQAGECARLREHLQQGAKVSEEEGA